MRKLVFMLAILLSANVGVLSAKDLTMKELAEFNGKNGKPAYIAIDGTIYDVTNATNWKDGVHLPTQGKLQAGTDGSVAVNSAPHKKEVLANLPVVGKVKK